MAIDYRDYGWLHDSTEAYKTGTLTPVRGTRTQVYSATHQGELRLPLMNRSFISFSYGGKWIEDFNLIATTSGDRMSRDGYASFADNVTESNNLEGQSYWGTHYRNNTLELTLTTDGITAKELDEFKRWFRAGEAKELVLAEHPNRAILARVAAPPHLEVLPFEEKVNLTISGVNYPTSTTLFKGDITLTLVADSPHWYSRINVLGIRDGSHFEDKWINANGVKENIFASKDALKIIYEDGIPVGSMIDANILLGDGTYANVSDNLISLVWSLSETVQDYETLGEGARIDDGSETLGVIAGAVIDASGRGIVSLPKYNVQDPGMTSGYFFYAGTAPAFTEIRFTLQPSFGENYYIVVPRNKWSPKTSGDTNEYNTITIQSRTAQYLIFTTPNLYTSYNKTLDIFYKYLNANYSWEEVRKKIRDNIRHSSVRSWASKVLDYGEAQWSNNGIIDTTSNPSLAQNLALCMSYFLCNGVNRSTPYPVTFTFNSETGAAKGQFQYRTITTNTPSSGTQWYNYGINEIFREEDVGDMLRSNHIIIRDRNYPTERGRIANWQDTETARTYSHSITHDVVGGLTNFLITYRNMYL